MNGFGNEDEMEWEDVAGGEDEPKTPMQERSDDEEWEDVPGGDAAPQTPRREQEENVEEEERERPRDRRSRWMKRRDDGAGEEECEEVGRRPKQAPVVKKVSKAEREEHEATHCPFQSWCKYCVEGRSQKAAHYRDKGEDEEDKKNKVPRISMD